MQKCLNIIAIYLFFIHESPSAVQVETLCEAGVTEESGGFFSSFHENKWSKPKIVGFYYADILTISDRAPIMNKEASHIAQVLRQHYPQLVVCLVRKKWTENSLK